MASQSCLAGKTSAGRGSWHAREVQSLPLLAFEQFAYIMLQSELTVTIPEDLAATWITLVPPAADAPC